MGFFVLIPGVYILFFFDANLWYNITIMRKRNIYIIPLLCLISAPAVADWQYPGTYVGDGWYEDDGSRFVISGRGGASFGFASIKNKVGAVVNEYWIEPNSGDVVSATYYENCVDNGGCAGYVKAGYGELETLPPTKNFKGYAFAAGASIGWTLPHRPQWRIEASWDHIAKSDYNSSPMFSGDMDLVGGDVSNVTINAQSAAVNSTITTDIIGGMAFYDFFDGLQKPVYTMIPYIGFGLGYADTKTVLNLSDPYGDLSAQVDFQQFGEVDEYGVTQFYKSETTTSNVAGLLAFGVSYGITDTMFMDFGVRIAYIPRVKWELTNETETRHREFFNAENLVYTNAMLGLRFEF